MAVWGAVPVAAVVPLFTAGTYRHYRGTTTIVVLILAESVEQLTKKYTYVPVYCTNYILVTGRAKYRCHGLSTYTTGLLVREKAQ